MGRPPLPAAQPEELDQAGLQAPRRAPTTSSFRTRRSITTASKDWRALLFPPFAPVLFVLAALPAALLLGYLWSANAGYIAMLTMASYFLMYEGLHTLVAPGAPDPGSPAAGQHGAPHACAAS